MLLQNHRVLGYDDRFLVSRRWMKRCCRDRSFVDVGGLWSIKGEMVSSASRAGASSVAMWDIYPPDAVEWNQLRGRLDVLGVGNCEFISGDVMDDAEGRLFDVVHCLGVIYHLPDVLRFLGSLRRMTRERLIVGGIMLPERTVNDAGEICMLPSSALFVPGLSDEQRQVLGRAWGHEGDLFRPMVMRNDLVDMTMTYAAWWWLFGYDCFASMVQMSGFEILDSWKSHSYMSLYCKPC